MPFYFLNDTLASDTVMSDEGNFFLDESSFRLKLSLYLKFQLPMCPGTGLKVFSGGGGWVVGV